MVESNNKLNLPNYTRFENIYLDDFEINNEIEIKTQDIHCFNTDFELKKTILDKNVSQIEKHLNKIKFANVFEVLETYKAAQKISIIGNANFRAHSILNISKNTTNQILISYDFNSNFSTNALEIFAFENSHTDLIIDIKGSGQNSNFIKAKVFKNASLNIYFINSFENDLNDVSVSLFGINSSSNLKTIAIAKNAKKYFSLRIDHFAKHSYGRIVNHGIGLDNSKLVINGFGKIHKDCKHSDNYQKTKVLCLSSTSSVEANPILLIDEYDVVASHAASITNVSFEQLNYLNTRGIDKKTGKIILIRAFLTSLITQISNDELKSSVVDKINKIIGYENDIQY